MRGIIEIETQVARLQAADKKFATLRSLDFNWLTKLLCPPLLLSSFYLISCFTTSPIPLFFLFRTLIIKKEHLCTVTE